MDRDSTRKRRYFQSKLRLEKNSSLWSCTGSIKSLDTSIHGSATQERNFNFSCIEKLGVKSVLGEIVPELDPIKQVNLANFVISESPKFKSLGHPAVNATDIRNIDFISSTRANSLAGTGTENIPLTRQTDLMTTLHNNSLTRSTYG